MLGVLILQLDMLLLSAMVIGVAQIGQLYALHSLRGGVFILLLNAAPIWLLLLLLHSQQLSESLALSLFESVALHLPVLPLQGQLFLY